MTTRQFAIGSGLGLVALAIVIAAGVRATDAPPRPEPYQPHFPRPTKTKHVAAIYPVEARAAGIHGIVILELSLDVDGRVSDARVLRGVPGLDQAAIDAVRQWEFTRTIINGQPVPTTGAVTVAFELPPESTISRPSGRTPRP